MTPHFMIMGYSLDWWWTAVVMPVFLGVKWYFGYRERGVRLLIENLQSENSRLRADLTAIRADLEAARNVVGCQKVYQIPQDVMTMMNDLAQKAQIVDKEPPNE